MPSELRVDKVSSTTSPYDPVFSTTGGALSHRNMIINGAMQISQRGVVATAIASSGTYSLDRFIGSEDTDGSFTIQQSSTAPAGFTKSLLLTITGADSSIAHNQTSHLGQRIEGQNIEHLAWGTSDAKTVTLSFWVRSSVTGTFGGGVTNSAENRSYNFSYTISSANTWEKKTITIPGDTSGTWLTTNGIGMRVVWSIGSGTTYSQSAGSWTATAKYMGTTGQTQLIATNGATFYLTGVQLELGSVATPFEHRSYGEELAKCQRYYQNSYRLGEIPATSSPLDRDGQYMTRWNDGNVTGPRWTVAMRAAPSVTIRGYGSSTTGQVKVNGGSFITNSSANSINHQSCAYIHINDTTSGVWAHYTWEAFAEL